MLFATSKLFAQYTDFNDFEIYTAAKNTPNPHIFNGMNLESKLFKLTSRNAINSSGLGGLFVAETAEKLKSQQIILSSRFKYHEITSTKGQAFYSSEEGSVSTFETSMTWIGDWGDWSINVPVHRWDLSAPRTFGKRADSNNGIGNISLGFKYTDLKDHSYYRFALGTVVSCDTKNTNEMAPAGSSKGTTTKLFGCVTTKETDKATANLELGALLNKEKEDWFLYNFGLTYEITDVASFIGEIAGEVAGGNDKDNMDMILGFRLAPTSNFTFEAAYYKNLRTYRQYGWDNQFQIGGTLQW